MEVVLEEGGTKERVVEQLSLVSLLGSRHQPLSSPSHLSLTESLLATLPSLSTGQEARRRHLVTRRRAGGGEVRGQGVMGREVLQEVLQLELGLPEVIKSQ